jgi:hypothetical protein
MRVSEVIIDCSLYVIMPITLLLSGPVSPLYPPRAVAVRTHLELCAGRVLLAARRLGAPVRCAVGDRASTTRLGPFALGCIHLLRNMARLSSQSSMTFCVVGDISAHMGRGRDVGQVEVHSTWPLNYVGERENFVTYQATYTLAGPPELRWGNLKGNMSA